MKAQQIIVSIAAIIGGLLLFVGLTFGRHLEGEWQPQCEGPYKDRRPSHEELAEVLREHEAWLKSLESNDQLLSQKDPRRANLCRALLENIKFGDVIQGKVNLRHAFLNEVYLQAGGLLAGGNLQEAYLYGAHLQGNLLIGTDFQGADLTKADLQGAVLSHFPQAFLPGANLQKAMLNRANLQGVNLIRADLSEASLDGANLAGVIFEPLSLPTLIFVAHSRNLEKMMFVNSPIALVELREAFKKVGMRTQERQM